MAQTTPGSNLGNVLVATDFSADAELAVARGALLPLSIGASLELLHVLPKHGDASLRARLDILARRRLEHLRVAAAGMLADAGIPDRHVVVELEHGKPFLEIARSAHNGRDELIVVGRHGERALSDLLVGSTAERLIRKADVSLLIVSTLAERPYRRPLVAVDFSESSRMAIDLALRISDPKLSQLDVLHVLVPSARHFHDTSPTVDTDQRLQMEEEHRVCAKLVEFLRPFDNHVKWNLILRTGEPRRMIIEAASSLGSDLIALGTQGRTGLAHVLAGSVAEAIVRLAHSDVLVAKHPRVD